MMDRKKKIVSQLTSGISGLFKANKVTQVLGHAKIIDQIMLRLLLKIAQKLLKQRILS